MKPTNLKTKIFLDSGNPVDTKNTLDILGFLDGQTTNPSLFAKNPTVQERMKQGNKFSKSEVNEFYKKIIQDISHQIPEGSVSVEVYADSDTDLDQIIEDSRVMNGWIPNAHIKLPITKAGLEAAEILVQQGVRVNMTLCFSQEQAGAVHSATAGASKGMVYVSPFIGRLDDRGENGMDLIKNILKMYKESSSHVELLAASTRSLEHHLYCIALGADIITSPYKILDEWSAQGMIVSDEHYQYNHDELKPIGYKDLDITKAWTDFDISHELTDAGLQKFTGDWNELIEI